MHRNVSKIALAVAFTLVACVGWPAAAQDIDTLQPPGPVHIKAGTRIMLDLSTPLNSATARPDDEVWLTVRNNIRVDGVTALPRGTPIRGSVTAVKPAVVNGKNQRTEIQIRLEEIPFEQGGSVAISTPILKVQGEKAGAGASSTALGALGGATQGALLGGLISRGARGAGIGAAAGAGVAILASVMQPKGSNSDVDLAAGSIFETKLDRPITISNPKLLANNVPTSATSPSTPGANAPTVSPAVEVSAVDRSTSTDSRAEESSSGTVPTFEPLPAEASTSSASSTASAEPIAVTPNGNITASTLRVDVNLVQVDAVVRDRAGKPMNNLRQDDFRVFEDGVEQRIQFFSRDSLPLAVAIVIDRSGSVAPLMGQVQSAAFQALQLLKTGDQVALFSFASKVELLEELTSERQRVANRIGGITAGGGTAIVDGVSEALRYLDTVAPDKRRAVILISDNVEGDSHTRVDDAVTFALESEAVVYSVKVGAGHGGLFSGPGIPGLPMPRIPFPGTGGGDPVKVLTKETGGEIFDATSGISIATALTSAVDRLKLRYTLSYAAAPVASRSSKGGYHRIEVQLVSRFGKPDTDYTIHSRSGYYDPQERSKVAASRP
ncbi:MAG TPA: VWA domain-containing protein [Terriglobia bacterium]|nr:VWA domain-containing protein [Terriglobia bacterium]